MVFLGTVFLMLCVAFMASIGGVIWRFGEMLLEWDEYSPDGNVKLVLWALFAIAVVLGLAWCIDAVWPFMEPYTTVGELE